MDLYEALKSGKTEEDLLEDFKKQLNSASERITEEKEAKANEAYLDACRNDLVAAILIYAQAFLGEECDEINTDSIKDILINYEKEMKETLKASKKLDEILTKAKKDNKEPFRVTFSTHMTDKDQDIINKFLDSLK